MEQPPAGVTPRATEQAGRLASGTSIVLLEEKSHAFIVRIWLEPREIEGVEGQWRGSIEHVESGRVNYWTDLDEGMLFIRSYFAVNKVGTSTERSFASEDIALCSSRLCVAQPQQLIKSQQGTMEVCTMANENVYSPHSIERECGPSDFDTSQISLGEVDATESVFSRTLVLLRDAALPSSLRLSPLAYQNYLHGLQGEQSVSYLKQRRDDYGTDYEPIPPIEPDPDETDPPDPPVDPLPEPPEKPAVQAVSFDLCLVLQYRQDWTPSGYGIGEILYSISLLPNEETTLEFKTWETSKTQQDSEIEIEERFVSDIKTSVSDSSEASSGYASKMHTYADAKASYSGFGFSASVQAGFSKDVEKNRQQMAKQIRERSEQSTNERRSARKVKVALSREQGSESKTTRKLRNINQAHSLNANFFEVLRAYDVKLSMYEVSVTILGPEVDLSEQIRAYTWWGPKSKYLTVGHLIRYSQSEDFVGAFVERYGLSPVKHLYTLWSSALYEAAWPSAETGTHEQRRKFLTTMLQYVRPTRGWIDIDETGVMRWSYEVIADPSNDNLKAVLAYLYQFIPFSNEQFIALAQNAGMSRAEAMTDLVNRYNSWSLEELGFDYRFKTPESRNPDQILSDNTSVIQADNHFNGIEYENDSGQLSESFVKYIDDTVNRIVTQVQEVRATIGQVDEWKASLPTQGVHADLSLGICSGAEDWIEVNRHFDLELKRLEIERQKLEIEKMKLLDKRLSGDSRHEVVVSDSATDADININLNISGDEDDISGTVAGG